MVFLASEMDLRLSQEIDSLMKVLQTQIYKYIAINSAIIARVTFVIQNLHRNFSTGTSTSTCHLGPGVRPDGSLTTLTKTNSRSAIVNKGDADLSFYMFETKSMKRNHLYLRWTLSNVHFHDYLATGNSMSHAKANIVIDCFNSHSFGMQEYRLGNLCSTS